jgi:hypothetical protein
MGCNKGVSAEELRAIFDGLDSNKDGKLGKGELDTYMTVRQDENENEMHYGPSNNWQGS